MSTGNFDNWDGNVLDIGPIYPFVGYEGLMVILCIVFWVGWHVIQIRMENAELDSDARELRKPGNLAKAVQDEHTPERM
jgi:hypothetical protein